MPGSILGTAVRRVEDPELITGATSYVGNIVATRTDVLHAVFVRSPLAHALVENIETARAEAADGVVAVHTARTLDLPAHHGLMVLHPGTPRPPLAVDRVRFAGEAVALVVARTRAQAVDAAELVEVDYDPLPAVVDPEAALSPDAELQFPELGSNVAAGLRVQDSAAALEDAEVVVRARMVNQRLAVVPMEGNAIIADPTTEDFPLTVHVSTQMPHGFRNQLAGLFGYAHDQVRVVAPHVGGGFGGKAGMLAEHTATIGAARALGRPVAWVETRSENLQSMPHGRGQIAYYELGLTREGRMTGLRCRVIGDAGAYSGFGGALPIHQTYTMAPGVYDIPKVGYDTVSAMTTTTPMGAFRGAGRPEAAAHLERLVDLAAAELGMDPVELRRRNFLDPAAFPLVTPVGAHYDVGDYDLPLREALRLGDYEKLREEQAARREAKDPVQLGIGLAVYVEITAGGGGSEYGSVRVHEDDGAGTGALRVTVQAGTSAHGQGHATSFAMLVSDRLGIPMDAVTYEQSDTASVPRGGGTGGSRSLQLGGSAVRVAADDVREQAVKRAAALLEANPTDVELTDGVFGVVGVPSATVSWGQVLEEGEIVAGADQRQANATFPFGAHLSVVEVDTETGRVTPRSHIAVDDCGRVLNPLLVEGQQHGGLAQGIAQALFEEVLFDADGNPTTATLADYHIPTAADLFSFEAVTTETPTHLNVLGAKGIGESATIGSTPAVQNAVVDALAPFGVRHIDLPCTPERVWRAVRSGGADPWREPPGHLSAVLAGLPVRGGDVRDESGAI